MQPVVLLPARGVHLFFAALSLVGCGLGAAFVADGRASMIVIGSALILLFALVGWANLAVLRPGAAFLRIEDDGFTYKWGAKQASYAWTDVERFGPAPSGRVQVVGIRLLPHHPRFGAPRAGEYHDTMPTYSMDLRPLLELLEERRRHVRNGSLQVAGRHV